MTPSEFIAWMRGYLVGCEDKRPSLEQWQEIRAKLAGVPIQGVPASLHPLFMATPMPAYGPTYAPPMVTTAVPPGLPNFTVTCCAPADQNVQSWG